MATAHDPAAAPEPELRVAPAHPPHTHLTDSVQATDVGRGCAGLTGCCCIGPVACVSSPHPDAAPKPHLPTDPAGAPAPNPPEDLRSLTMKQPPNPCHRCSAPLPDNPPRGQRRSSGSWSRPTGCCSIRTRGVRWTTCSGERVGKHDPRVMPPSGPRRRHEPAGGWGAPGSCGGHCEEGTYGGCGVQMGWVRDMHERSPVSVFKCAHCAWMDGVAPGYARACRAGCSMTCGWQVASSCGPQCAAWKPRGLTGTRAGPRRSGRRGSRRSATSGASCGRSSSSGSGG